MAAWTVHIPPEGAGDGSNIRFVREGFALAAFALPALWLILRRLWVEAALFLALLAAGGWLLTEAGADEGGLGLAMLAVNALMGFEGRDVERFGLAQRGWQFAGVVAARSLDDAEQRWFAGFTPRPALARPPFWRRWRTRPA